MRMGTTARGSQAQAAIAGSGARVEQIESETWRN